MPRRKGGLGLGRVSRAAKAARSGNLPFRGPGPNPRALRPTLNIKLPGALADLRPPALLINRVARDAESGARASKSESGRTGEGTNERESERERSS